MVVSWSMWWHTVYKDFEPHLEKKGGDVLKCTGLMGPLSGNQLQSVIITSQSELDNN